MPNIRVEAESLVLSLNSTSYVVENGAFASGGQLIRLPNDGTLGSITHDFDLASGTYNIVIGYYDENDGLSPYSLKQKSSNQDWVNLDSWVADKNLGDSRASAKNFVTRKISGVNLTTGDQVQVQGQLHTGEVARIDYIEYIPISILPPPIQDTTAPTATATATDISQTLGSNNSYTFTVTYSDDKGVKVSSLDSQDIRVTGPNGFNQLATFVSVDNNSDGTPRTATYSINAPGGSWDSNEAGNYSVAVEASQVSDTSDNSVVNSELDTFGVSIESPPVDTTAPTATATATDITLTSGSNNSYTFTVTYSDDKGVKVSSLDSQDIRVTGPNGFNQLATFVSVDNNSDGTPRTATYSINAPGGSWDSNEAGSYSVAVEASQVSDTSDNSVVNSTLDTFQVSLESSPPPASKVRIEAEGMTLAGYKIESGTFASQGEYIGLLSPNTTGNATQAFSGVSSVYDIVVGYFDESDGQSPLSISVGGNKISEWVANQSTGGTRASATNFSTKTIPGVQVNFGDEIQLTGILQAGENARFDYVEFIPVVPPTPDTTAPTATATATDISRTVGSNNSYTFTVTYSDDKGVKVSSLDSQDIRVTGPNGFNQLATFVSVDNNSDGTPRTATYSINAPGGSWDSNEAGSYSVAVEASQVSDTSDNSVVNSELDTFQVDVQTPTSNPMDIVTIEGEAMTLAGGYRIESGIFASGGKFIGLSSALGATGTATTEDFSGVSGAYDIVVRYFDESDGQSQISLGVEGTTVGTWTANQSLGASNASAQTLTEIVFKNVQVNQNDKIEINGAINSGENARIDRIEFVPAGDNIAPTPSFTANNSLSVTSGDTQAYTFSVQYTDNLGVDASTIDSQDLRVTGPNGFNQLATLVSNNLNSDGKVATATYRINAPGDSWNLNEAGTYTVAMQSNQVLDRINNPVASGTLGTFSVSVNSSGNTADYSQASKGVNINLEQGIGYIPDKDQTLKIMPLGDSITAGKENGSQSQTDWVGYRLGLWQRFESLGVPIDFVGSQSKGTANLPDKDNEGHAGWTINDIKDGRSTDPGSGVNNWIPASDPDVVLLMIGTNDASGNVSTMGSRLNLLIDKILANPSFDNGDLLVSTIAPINPNSSYYDSRMQNAKDYNALIPGIVDSKPASENVKFVDMWQGSNPILETDITAPPADSGLHPTANGYEKMANYWFDSILNATGQKQVLEDKTIVKGSAYNDVIVGNTSNNILQGGEGNDKLTGSGGADTFVYNNPNQGQDTLTDFTPSQGDVFNISAAGFGAGLVAGTALSTTASNTGVFVSGTTLNYLGDIATFFYNTSTGLLGFDPDGNQSQSLIPLAQLTNKPTLTANQFVIV